MWNKWTIQDLFQLKYKMTNIINKFYSLYYNNGIFLSCISICGTVLIFPNVFNWWKCVRYTKRIQYYCQHSCQIAHTYEPTKYPIIRKSVKARCYIFVFQTQSSETVSSNEVVKTRNGWRAVCWCSQFILIQWEPNRTWGRQCMETIVW